MLLSLSASSAPVPAEPTLSSGDAANCLLGVASGSPGQANSGPTADSSPPKPVAFADLLDAAAPAGGLIEPATAASAFKVPGDAANAAPDSDTTLSSVESAPSAPAPRVTQGVAPRPASFRRSSSIPQATQPDADAAAMILAGMLPAPATAASAPALLSLEPGSGPATESAPNEAAAASTPFPARAKDLSSTKKADGTDLPVPATLDEYASVASTESAASDVIAASEPAAVAEKTAPAVFADPLSDRSGTRAGAVDFWQKNTTQETLYKFDKDAPVSAGMEKAKGGAVMTSASAQLSFAVLSRRAVEAVKPVASFADSAAGFSPAAVPAGSSVASSPSPAVAETVSASTPLPAAAVRLIDRVEEVAERVEARAADNVRVSLDLDGSHRVEVKVALRGGRVFADFRTDSPEMRAALTEAWGGFVRGRDGASQRWADPVFSSLDSASASVPEAPAPVHQASGSFERDLSSRQETADDHRQAPRRELTAEENARPVFSAPSVRVASAASISSARPDPSRLLSAVA